MIDVKALNSQTNLEGYNCGGFALGIGEWYDPESYDKNEPIADMLNQCADDIMWEFPELSRVSHYSGIPKKYDVIGFRLSIQPNGSVYDFHFILRSKGTWYHKPGSRKVSRINFNIEHLWPHPDHLYNSEIVWFMRDHIDISVAKLQEKHKTEEEDE